MGRFFYKNTYWVGIAITIIFSFLFLIKFFPLKLIELKNYDLFVKVRSREKIPNDIVLITIDDNSLERIGRWPWDRRIMAKLIYNLSRFEPAVIGLDIIFSEPSKDDMVLAKAMDYASNIIVPGVLIFHKKDMYPKKLAEEFALSVKRNHLNLKYLPPSGDGLLVPIDIFQDVAAGFGLINMFPDTDGTLRWESLYFNYHGFFIPSFTLEITSLYLGIPRERILVDPAKGIYLGNKKFIPTDVYGRMLIPYFNDTRTLKKISAYKVLENQIRPEDIQGKIVLIGATAIGIYDLRVTPLTPVMPGVEKHAHVIGGILKNRFFHWADDNIVLCILIFSGLLFSFLFQTLKAFYSSLIFMLVAITGFLFDFYLFDIKNYYLPVDYPFINCVVIFLCSMAIKYGQSEKRAFEIKKIFSSYVTERVVNQLMENPSLVRLGGERKEVSILFSDIRGFTSLSEDLNPEEVVELLNEYFKEMTEVIFESEGTLDKFIGDAIMVFWGAPLPQDDHAIRAVQCAVNMLEKLKPLKDKWKKEKNLDLDIGIGINTGEVLVGNIGVEGKKMDYTVIGDHVNLASRLEGLNKKFNTNIIVSEFTLKMLDVSVTENICISGLAKVQVKGKKRPVKIYSIEFRDGPCEIREPSNWELIKMDTK